MKAYLEKLMKYYSKNEFLVKILLLFILIMLLFFLYNNIKINKNNIENMKATEKFKDRAKSKEEYENSENSTMEDWSDEQGEDTMDNFSEDMINSVV